MSSSVDIVLLSLAVHVLHAVPLNSNHKTRSDDNLNAATFDQLLNRVGSLEAKLQTTQTQVADLQSQLQAEKQKTQQLQDENKRMVVFTAKMSTEVRASANAIIPFSNAIVNTGNGFDPATSVFTAPYDGVYMFFAYADITSDYRAFHITLKGSHIDACDNDGSMRRLACGLALSLHAGDTVTLVHFGNTGNIGGTASAFSGFRIR